MCQPRPERTNERFRMKKSATSSEVLGSFLTRPGMRRVATMAAWMRSCQHHFTLLDLSFLYLQHVKTNACLSAAAAAAGSTFSNTEHPTSRRAFQLTLYPFLITKGSRETSGRTLGHQDFHLFCHLPTHTRHPKRIRECFRGKAIRSFNPLRVCVCSSVCVKACRYGLVAIRCCWRKTVAGMQYL